MDRTTLCRVIQSVPVTVIRAGFTYAILASFVALVVVVLAAFEQSSSSDTYLPSLSDTVTFNKDIAPIVFAHCASCHHPGTSAPFSLLTYEDVKSRAQIIAAVTTGRIMPPWLPEPGYGEFSGDRRLSDEQINMIQRWVEEGAVEGDPSDRPPVPEWSEAWQLGEPDVVIEAPSRRIRKLRLSQPEFDQLPPGFWAIAVQLTTGVPPAEGSTVKMAGALVTLPRLLLTTTTISSPFSAMFVGGMISVAFTPSDISTPLRRH